MKTTIEIEWQTGKPPEDKDLWLMFKNERSISGPATDFEVYSYDPYVEMFYKPFTDDLDYDPVEPDKVLYWALFPLKGKRIDPLTGELVAI